MNARDLTRRERARRQVVVTLAELGEHVLDRERAADAILAGLQSVDVDLDTPRFEAVVCACPRWGAATRHGSSPAVLDRAAGVHVLFSRREIAERMATRWNHEIRDGVPLHRLYARHEATA